MMKKLIGLCIVLGLWSCSTESPEMPIPAYPTIADMRVMLDSNATTSVALVTALLARIDAHSALNAMISIDANGALLRAQELDAMRAAGDVIGPLHGIPYVVKDNIHVAGLPNSAGTPALAAFVPGEDNETVARLAGAGAIVLGKANMHELAFGITSDNAEFGSVGNPYDVALIPGGSSGGTASAIASGLAPFGLGTDTGGSVRIPAALTGIVGFRPSMGRYPSTAVTPISHTRDTVGVMGQSVADMILLDDVITSPAQAGMPVATDDISLGIPRAFYFDNLDAELSDVVDAALDKLSAAGITLVEVDPPGIESLLASSGFPIALYEFAHELPAYLDEYRTNVTYADVAAVAASPDVQGVFAALEGEANIPDDVYAAALAAREELRSVFRDYFATNGIDAMLFPTTPLPARPIQGSVQTVTLNGVDVPTFGTYIRNTDSASLAALPGISLPIGLTAAGLPVGIELDGPEQSDRRLLGIAARLEQIFAFNARPLH